MESNRTGDEVLEGAGAGQGHRTLASPRSAGALILLILPLSLLLLPLSFIPCSRKRAGSQAWSLALTKLF